MARKHRRRWRFAIVAVALVVAACSQVDQSPSDTCPPGDPACEDVPATVDGSATTSPDRGVPVAEAVSEQIDGAFEIRGFFLADDSGARICETLLESFPPQCGGASLPVGDFELDVPVTSEAGVTWSPDVVLLEGEIVGGVFQPLR